MTASADKETYPTRFVADAQHLQVVLQHFQNNLAEITLVALPQQRGNCALPSIQMVSHVSHAKGSAARLQTAAETDLLGSIASGACIPPIRERASYT